MKNVTRKAPPAPSFRRKDGQITLRLRSPELEAWLDARVEAEQAKLDEGARLVALSDVVRQILFAAMRAETASREGGS